MKRILLALALFLLPSIAFAQCNGVFPNNTVCGNITGGSNTPRPTNPTAFQGSAGGSNGQIQYNNSGTLGGFTASGDATVNTSTGAVIVTKTNGVAFGPPATGSASGNTTKFATVSGSLVNGNCVEADANGNLINNGTPCSLPMPIYNPIAYGAVGNGTTDDTAAWQSMCSAIQTAGGGWIISPPSKTYKILSNVLGSQTFCMLSNLKYLHVTMNGSQIVSHYISQIQITGTATNGDTLSWSFSSWNASGFPVTITITVTTSETTTQMATALAAAINANATLSTNQITATASTSYVTINDPGFQVSWYTGFNNGNPGLVVTGAGTEVLNPVSIVMFEFVNSNNITIDDFTATAYSGYGDSTRGSTQQTFWLACTNNSTSGYGCNGFAAHNLNISGCSVAVDIVRQPNTGTWSQNIEADGYVQFCGYPTELQNDGQYVRFNIICRDVGRAAVVFNTSHFFERLFESRSRNIGLESIAVGAVGYAADLSNNTTSDGTIEYSNDNSNTVTSGSFIELSHTQGSATVANNPSHVDNIHFKLDVTIPTGNDTQLIVGSATSGTSGAPTSGDVTGNTEVSDTIEGVVRGASTGGIIGCIAAASSGCSGYSSKTRADWQLRNLSILSDTGILVSGAGSFVTYGPNFFALAGSVPTQDSGSNAALVVYQAPVNFSGTTLDGASCTASGAVTVSHGAISSC